MFFFFNDKIGIIKLLNTTILISIALSNPIYSFYLGLNRLSSYPDKEYFGYYRNHYNGNYTIKNAFRYAVRSSLSQNYQYDLKVLFPIQKRVNFTGEHLDFKNSKGEKSDIFTFSNEFNDDEIKKLALDIYNTGTRIKLKFDNITDIFIQDLSQFFEKKSVI